MVQNEIYQIYHLSQHGYMEDIICHLHMVLLANCLNKVVKIIQSVAYDGKT